MAGRLQIIPFLEEYKKYPCLWEKNCADFKNRVKRDEAEQILLPMTGLSTIKELRQRIRSIRCTYNQEVTKIKNAAGTVGEGAKYVYTPKLAWFALADSFLRKNLEHNDEKPNLIFPEGVPLETKQEGNTTQNTEEPEQEPTGVLCPNPVVTAEVKSPPPQKRNSGFKRRGQWKNKKTKVDESLGHAVQAFKNVANHPTPLMPDEFTVFGQHVISQLRYLPLEEALKLQEEIQKLITAARLRSVERSKSHSNSSANDTDSNYQTSNSYEVKPDVPPAPQMDMFKWLLLSGYYGNQSNSNS